MGETFRELTYAAPTDPRLKRWIIHTVEGLSGREKFLPLYRYWRDHIVPKSAHPYGDVLNLVDVKMQVTTKSAATWPPPIPNETPLVMIANHPFGIGDGIAILAMAEQLGRPFKVLINNQLMRIPEFRPFSLPIDFDAGLPEFAQRGQYGRHIIAGIGVARQAGDGIGNPFTWHDLSGQVDQRAAGADFKESGGLLAGERAQGIGATHTLAQLRRPIIRTGRLLGRDPRPGDARNERRLRRLECNFVDGVTIWCDGRVEQR